MTLNPTENNVFAILCQGSVVLQKFLNEIWVKIKAVDRLQITRSTLGHATHAVALKHSNTIPGIIIIIIIFIIIIIIIFTGCMYMRKKLYITPLFYRIRPERIPLERNAANTFVLWGICSNWITFSFGMSCGVLLLQWISTYAVEYNTI